jgi:hypothetical protein
MRVPWEARQIILWDVVSEIVEEKKWIEIRGVAEAECAAQMNARALESWFSADESLDGSNRHDGLPYGECTLCNSRVRVGQSYCEVDKAQADWHAMFNRCSTG